MQNPALQVLAYFDGLGNPPTDITSYCRDGVGFQMDRGARQVEPTGFVADTGTLALELDNRARVFDPDYAAGPHFGKLVPGVPMDLKASYTIGMSTGTYQLFRGFVDDWEQRYSVNGDQTVALKASDVQARIAQAQVALSRPFESTGARIQAIFDEIDTISVFAGVVDTGLSDVFPLSYGTVTAASVITDATQVEWGDFFISAAGRATFRDRHALYNDVASRIPQAVFGDTSDLKYTDAKRVRFPVVNDITIVWNDHGASINAGDGGSQALPWGKQSLNLSLPFAYAAQATAYAQWLLTLSHFPRTVFGSVTFKPQRDPDNLFPIALVRELGEMITVTKTPKVNGILSAPITGNCWIRGISHTYQAQEWTTTYTLQDASWMSGVFRLDSSLLDSTDFLPL